MSLQLQINKKNVNLTRNSKMDVQFSSHLFITIIPVKNDVSGVSDTHIPI